MSLSNTAVPKYYGAFREAVLRGEIFVNKEISMEMNRIDALIADRSFYYDDQAVEGWVRYCESELTLTDGSDLNLLDTFKLWGEQIFGWYYFVDRSVYEPYPDGHGGRYVRKTIKKRLVNKQYLIVARGAAKSMYASTLQSYFLNVDTSTTHQITTAPTMKQAEEVLSPIRTSIVRSRGPLFQFLTEGSLQNTTGSKANRMKLASTKKGIENFLTGSLLEIRPMSIAKLQGLQVKIATVDEWLSGDIREDVIGAIEQGASKVDDYIIVESLFPDYKDLKPGAPELLTRDQGWVNVVIDKVHKTPIGRIRTRQMDARNENARGQGYQKGKRKTPAGNMKMLSRTTDPQTVYCIDALHRDDVTDITDFDVIEYQYGVMKQNLYEEVAIAIMVGDGREEGTEMKISESHIRSIWNDDDLYTIHYDVDVAAARAELQGSRTDMNFGENFIYAEAIVAAAMYSREKYKGTGTPDLFCTPHLLNVMLLARDLNGRRIYDSKTDLAAALNVNAIYTAEQFEGLVRTDDDGVKHKLLGIFVNLNDYTVGSTKGGEITRFNQFDIDFNQHKLLIETRLSGALNRVYSAIALEEPVKSASGAAA